MTVVDIRCPTCGRADTVYKDGIGEYRCTECDRTFTPSEVRPGG